MTRYFPFLVLFVSPLVTGCREFCQECITFNGTFCSGNLRRCPSGSTSCLKVVAITEIGDTVLTSFSRGCNHDEQLCNKEFIMNSGQGNKRIRVLTKCCYKDNCNHGTINVPPYNNTWNNLLCPVCYMYKDYDCRIQGYIACRGHETECFEFSGTLLKKDLPSMKYAMMGCTTKNGCFIGQRIIPGITVTDIKQISCQPANPITH